MKRSLSILICLAAVSGCAGEISEDESKEGAFADLNLGSSEQPLRTLDAGVPPAIQAESIEVVTVNPTSTSPLYTLIDDRVRFQPYKAVTSLPEVAANIDMTVLDWKTHVLAATASGTLYQTTRTSSGSWATSWTNVSTLLTLGVQRVLDVSATSYEGKLQVCALLAGSPGFMHATQASDGHWTRVQALTTASLRSVDCFDGNNGLLYAFVVTSQGTVTMAAKSSTAAWSVLASITMPAGVTFDRITSAFQNGFLYAFARTATGAVYYIYSGASQWKLLLSSGYTDIDAAPGGMDLSPYLVASSAAGPVTFVVNTSGIAATKSMTAAGPGAGSNPRVAADFAVLTR